MKLFELILIAFIAAFVSGRIEVEGLSFGQRNHRLSKERNSKIVNQLYSRQSRKLPAQKRKLWEGTMLGATALAGEVGSQVYFWTNFYQTIDNLKKHLIYQEDFLKKRQGQREGTLNDIKEKIKNARESFDSFCVDARSRVGSFKTGSIAKVNILLGNA